MACNHQVGVRLPGSPPISLGSLMCGHGALSGHPKYWPVGPMDKTQHYERCNSSSNLERATKFPAVRPTGHDTSLRRMEFQFDSEVAGHAGSGLANHLGADEE